ncbi:hypothetical protein SISSUDRAFT_1053744 [Sistotremastrum suecicum HHB10207 ss-3]|uniref:Uncharacterized protein n=1 Tax=Sistotremastrum suecicum HHB10207 ss-3 TaxID=1314776 RepID=A0A165Z164_9AGAM|nr:hypothetical protein SISSUDRAFT_1053744 [Sistotremastrum suecicum HHB10207 ss-3]
MMKQSDDSPDIQNWNDYSILIGWSAHPFNDPTSIGSFVGSTLDLTTVGEVTTVSPSCDIAMLVSDELASREEDHFLPRSSLTPSCSTPAK